MLRSPSREEGSEGEEFKGRKWTRNMICVVGLLQFPDGTSLSWRPGNLEQSPPGSAGHSLTAHNGPRSLHSQPGLGVARVGLDGFDLMYVYYFISSEDTDINHWTEGKEKKNNCKNF